VHRKTTLYIDIDDTIIAEVLPRSVRDLRPCVITHLTVLAQLYDCCWLTSWPWSPDDAPPGAMCVQTLMRGLYAHRINETFRYADWDRDHPGGKAGFVHEEFIDTRSNPVYYHLPFSLLMKQLHEQFLAHRRGTFPLQRPRKEIS